MGTSGYNAPLNDAERAAYWQRYEEGQSMPQIAREFDRSESTVCKVLHEDPKRLGTLRDSFRQLRAERFASLERRSSDAAHQVIDRLMDVTKDEKTFTTEFQSMNVTGAAKALQALAGLGQGSAKTHELLTGNATERTATSGNAAAEVEALIDRAVTAGQPCIDALPEPYRSQAQILFDERSRPTA